MTVKRISVVRCPHCGYQRSETMPISFCQIRYVCRECGAELRPKEGDCCIFCSYGDWPCPPEQDARHVGQDSPSADD